MDDRWPQRRRDAEIRRSFAALALSAVLCGLSACSNTPVGSTAPASAGVSSPGASPEIPTLSRLSVDEGQATASIVGPAGGTLESIGAGGTTYRLDIPAGALIRETRITMIPLSSIPDLPEGIELAGGVHLLPEGLTLFPKPAELTIELADVPQNATLAFAYRGDMEGPFRYPTRSTANAVTFGIAHFSGYAQLMATTAALDAADMGLKMPWLPPSAPGDLALASIAAVIDGGAGANVDGVLGQWLSHLETMRDTFVAMTTFDLVGPFGFLMFDAQLELTTWFYVERLLALSGITIDPTFGPRALGIALRITLHAVGMLNDCPPENPAASAEYRMPELFAWQSFAELYGFAGQNPQLGRDFLIEHACVQVEFHPEDGTEFPYIEPGSGGTLGIHVRLVVQGADPTGHALRVEVTTRGALPPEPIGAETDNDGRSSHDFVFDPAATELRLDIRACIRSTPICADAIVVRGGPGTQIIFSSDRGGQRQMYTMDDDGGDLNLLPYLPLDGSWSRDGSRVVYRTPGASDLWISDASGSNETKLLDPQAPGGPQTITGQAISPDAKRVAFCGRFPGDRAVQLHVMDADGANRFRLLGDATDGSEHCSAVAWAPDGRRLAFARQVTDGEEHHLALWVINADGTDPLQVAPMVDGGLAWTPDGERIAYHVQVAEGNVDIRIANADGSGDDVLIGGATNDYTPTWSPDGSRFAFMSDRDQNPEIYVASDTGGNIVNLTNNASADRWPVWIGEAQ
jgi:Tol biopolymer transport system component